ncbi:S49 family peptidase [Tsuneonella sp. HG094]
MDAMLPAGAVWAMHPDYLSAMLRQGAVEAMLPDALRHLATAFGGNQAAQAAPDPIRDGSTMIVPMKGVIAPKQFNTRVASDVLADRIREIASDSKVGAIVLDIASPGGLVFGTAELGDAVFEARQAKPVVAVANSFAFSAAYWVASQASAFYGSTSSEVGSVGVRSGHVDESGFEAKLGFKTTLVASHPDKISGHPYGPLSDDDLAEIQSGVDESYAAFNAAIARGRGIKAGDVAGIHGTGKVFSAQRATERGAIDGVMTLREVVAKYGSSRSRLQLMRRQAAVAEAAAGI